MRYADLQSDRGDTFTLLCIAVNFGLVCGCFVIPGLILSLYVAAAVYTAVSFVFAETIALCIGMAVYYTGMFLVCTIAPVVYETTYNAVAAGCDIVAQGVCAVTNTLYQGFQSLRYYTGV